MGEASARSRPLERVARGRKGGARELAGKGWERPVWVCSWPRARARARRVGGGAPLRAQGRGRSRQLWRGSTGGAGVSPASGRTGPPPASSGSRQLPGAAGRTHTGRPGQGSGQSTRPGRGGVGPSPPTAPGRVSEAELVVRRPLAGREKRSETFFALLPAVSRPSAAWGGVVVAGGGGGRHVGVCEKRGAPRPLPSCWGQPAGAQSESRSRSDAAAGLQGRREGPRLCGAGAGRTRQGSPEVGLEVVALED